MRRQLTVSIALLCATVLFATESPGQPVPRALDHVLDTVRAAHASRGLWKIVDGDHAAPEPQQGAKVGVGKRVIEDTMFLRGIATPG